MKIFRYLEEVDAFIVTDQYHRIADSLGLSEWNPVVWIGRLFLMDNNFGEHWFDNWDLRYQRGPTDEHLVINPDRFQNAAGAPCHTPEFRKRFWTQVLVSLE